jgi:large subunit ribosomal protein L9
MEVILKRDVENLGFTDDLVEVKNGYGRNYLIPQGMAVLATSSAKKVLAETMRQRAHRDAKLIKDAQAVAKTLEDVKVRIMSKTADGVKLFGSVTNADVSEALGKQGHELDRKFISIDGRNIKRIGEYVAHIRLHRELIVDLPFEIYPDPASLPKKKKVEDKSEEVIKSQEEDEFAHRKESIDDVLNAATKKKVENKEEEVAVTEEVVEAVKEEEVEAKTEESNDKSSEDSDK